MSDIFILLNGKPYALRPTFAALHVIEQQLGTGVVALAIKLLDGSITLAELVFIIMQCTEASQQQVEESLSRGLVDIIASVSRMFAMVLSSETSAITQGDLRALMNRFPD